MRDWTDVGVLLVCALVAPACGRGVPSAADPVPSASDPCAGLTPSLPPAKTFTITKEDEGGLYCGSATSDGLGNLYFEGSFFTIKSSTGAVVSAQILFAPLASGFAAFGKSMSPDTQYSAYSPQGAPLSHVPFNGYANGVGLQANGGTVLVDADCNWTNVVRVRRFDDTNAITSDVSLADQQCFPFASATISVIVDAHDRTLLLVSGPRFSGVSAGDAGARWFDAAGNPLTEWFDAGSFGGLLPLIGGGAAVRSGSAWVASIESGKAELSKPPPGFVANRNAVVVLGGRAYAMVPYGAAGTIDIVEPGGRTCASLLTVSAADRFSIGKDGTLISLAGLNGGRSDCTATYYPKALE